MERIRYMISDAAKRLDVEAHVLRYWEEELGVDIPRNELGHRYYTEQDITMMSGVKTLKEKGFQLKSIRILLPEISKVMELEPRRLLELRDRLELAVSREELRQQREAELRKEGHGQETGCRTDIGPLKAAAQAEKEKQEGERIERENVEKEDIEKGEKRGYINRGQAETNSAGKKNEDSLIPVVAEREEVSAPERMDRFRSIMNEIIMEAFSEGGRQLTGSITESVSREISYHFKQREMMEEEHYKQLDRTLREYQQGQKQAAVTREYQGGRRESKFFKKNKVRI